MGRWKDRRRDIAAAKALAVEAEICAEVAGEDGARQEVRRWRALARRYERLARQLAWIPDPEPLKDSDDDAQVS